MTDAIFISPHLDDAALSCGGGIVRLVRAGCRVTVVTVFTADQPADSPLTPLARRSHASWGAGEAPFETRRTEDRDALALLGAVPEHLGLLDAIYRRSASGDALYADPLASISAEDAEKFMPRLVDALRTSALSAFPEARVFCPAGVGGHVDHVLVRRAAEELLQPEDLVYYDEYPYVARPETAPLAGAGAAADWPVQHLALSPEEVDARIAAVARYGSQLRGLFPTQAERLREIASARIPGIGGRLVRPPDVRASAERMAARMREDLESVGGERYRWSPRRESPFPPA